MLFFSLSPFVPSPLCIFLTLVPSCPRGTYPDFIPSITSPFCLFLYPLLLNRSPTSWVRWPSTAMNSPSSTTARPISPCGSTWATRDPHRAWRAWRTWGHVIGVLYRQWRCLPCPQLPQWVPLCQGLALLRHPSDHRAKVPSAFLILPSSAPAHSNLDASRTSLVVGSGAKASDSPWLWNEGAGELVIQWGLVFRTWVCELEDKIFLILPGGIRHLKHTDTPIYSRAGDIFCRSLSVYFSKALRRNLRTAESWEGIQHSTKKKHHLVFSKSGLCYIWW